MYTRQQIADRFNPHPDTNPDILPRLTEGQISLLEQIQATGAQHGAEGWYPDGDFSSDADWCNGIGHTIRDLEETLNIDDGSIHDLYSEAHSEAFSDGTINPGDRDWAPQIWDFQFGAYGETKCSVHASSIEEALELAADWLEENEPEHIMLHGNGNDKRDPELDVLMAEVCAEHGLPYPPPEGTVDFEPYWDAEQEAYSDLTYTEAGYLTSYEWYVNER